MSNLNLQKLREWVGPWPWTFSSRSQDCNHYCRFINVSRPFYGWNCSYMQNTDVVYPLIGMYWTFLRITVSNFGDFWSGFIKWDLFGIFW